MMIFKYVNEDIIDVWFGSGWYNWVRFEIKRLKGNLYLHKVNGRSLPNEMFFQLVRELNNASDVSK